MSGLRVKAAGVLLALLVASMEFTPNLLVSRVLAQHDSYGDFLSRLEGYLRDALPPESDPVRECEYVAPEGFNASMAERLWRIVGSSVSMGASEEEIRSVLQNATSSGSSGMLNVTGTMVEKPGDGSVKVKIPVSSDKLLNYTYFNSTNVRILYEVWNETLVRYYEVERYTGLYGYVVKDIETGVVFDFVSRLGVSPFPGFALEDIMLVHPEENWPWFLGNPIIAVPGHYEEVKTLVPEHKESYRVLFPAYDPIIIEGWVVTTSVSSTSLSVGETLQISYLAEYCSFPGEEPEPLNATLTLNAPKSFQPLDGVERRLSDAHKSGSFNLKAVKPGTYNITLRLNGNAQFPHVPGDEETYTIQVVSPPAPSLSVEIVERDTSIPKHARLVLRLRNSGGSPARNVVVEIAGACLHGLDRSVGSIEAGETRDVELSLRLLNPSCDARIRVAYCDDDGNPYLVGFWTMVSTERFWVPEHFEEYVVTVPEHEEVTRVFVPGSEQATHVRFYWLTFSARYNYAKEAGQKEAMGVNTMLDGGGIEVPKQREVLRILREIAAKSREAERAISEFLMRLGPEMRREIIEVIGKVKEAEENVLKDVGKAWRLDDDVSDFYELLKGVEVALELRTRQEKVFKLLHEFIETQDRDRVAFLSRTLGWMAEVWKAFPEGSTQRGTIVDKVVELAEASNSRLDGAKMLRISKILGNLLSTHGSKGAYGLFIDYFYKHLLDYAGLKEDSVKPSLLEDCLSKWESASKVEDAYVSLMRFSTSEGSIRYQANTPEEVNYIMVDKDSEKIYIPVIATRIGDKESCITAIPHDAQVYLKEIGYLPGETGLILFTEAVPENARVIMPVRVEEEGKIVLTEWLERFLHKDADWRERYLIHTERGYVLNWENLDEDHVALRVRAMKDGEECERLILLKPHEQEIVRTRISHIAKPKEIVLCEFSFEEMPERLNVKDAEEIFRNQYWIEDEITVKSLAQNLHMVMLFTERDCLAATGEEKGPAGEWMTFRILWDYGLFKGYQVKVEGTEGNIFADFKARGEHLVEVKNIDPRWVSDEDWLSKLKGQLVKYEGIVRAKNAEDVLLFFCNPLGQEELASLNDKLSKWFDDLS